MANEATVRSSLYIIKDHLQYHGKPEQFVADVSTAKGPSPGVLTATTAGTVVDFSQLTTPGLCRIMNLDATNYVEVGIWDFSDNTLKVLLELLPGESYVVRLSRNLNEEYVGTGTGTTAPVNQMRIKANKAACVVLVEAFEK